MNRARGRTNAGVVAGVMLFCCAGIARASLIGDDVVVTTVNNLGGGIVTNSATVIDPGVEFAFDYGGGLTDIDIDFVADGVIFTATTSAGGGNGFYLDLTLSDLDWVGMSKEIVGFDVTGFLRPDVVTNVIINDGHSLTVQFRSTGTGFGWASGNSVAVEFQVPEPTTTTLLALGLFGAGYARRRRTH